MDFSLDRQRAEKLRGSRFRSGAREKRLGLLTVAHAHIKNII